MFKCHCNWVRYNWSWPSLNNCCSTNSYWNRNSINCYGIISSCWKSSSLNRSLKIEKHEKIAMLAVSSLNTISILISKALSHDFISDEEYSLILLKFEKSKMSLEKTGNIETEANELRCRKTTTIPTCSCSKPSSKQCSKPCSKLCSKPRYKTMIKNMFKTVFKNVFKTVFKTTFETVFENMFEI